VRAGVIETDHYRRKADRLLSQREQNEAAAHLAENPSAHVIIPGLGGLRKAWIFIPRRRKRIYRMPTKRNSVRRSKTSSGESVKKRSRLAQGLLKSMEEAKNYLDGKRPLRVRYYDVPDHIDVRAIREKVGMSQSQFALRFAISPRTLQEWEQGRRMPDATVRAYLTVIDRDPKAVEEALTRH
jgi:putative transcriptional regulator